MSKSERIKGEHAARESARARLAELQSNSLAEYISWKKSAPHWGYGFTPAPEYHDIITKAGDTDRGFFGPYQRMNEEWLHKFPNAYLRVTFPLMLDENHYVRDYYLHRVLNEMHFHNYTREELLEIFHDADAFSREMFNCSIEDVLTAWEWICAAYHNDTIDWSEVYTINRGDSSSSASSSSKKEPIWIDFRPNQQEIIDAAVVARNNKRTHLLLSACPRAGKSATSMGIAEAYDARTILVTSAVASVGLEWRDTIEGIANFADSWEYVDAKMLDADPDIVDKLLASGKRVLVFLTFQDIQGTNVKRRHEKILGIDFDININDETHIGARGESFTAKFDSNVADLSEDDIADIGENDALLEYVKSHFSYKCQLHLSGTPYNIMMSGEFAPEDIIGNITYSDILHDREKWFEDHPDAAEYENPYYDFPSLLTLAIVLDDETSALYNEMRKCGLGELTDIFAIDTTITDDRDGHPLLYPELVHRFFAALDGTQPDSYLYALLNDSIVNKRIGSFQGVFILSRIAQVDAVVDYLEEHKSEFKNLNSWRFFKATSNNKAMKSQKIKEMVEDSEADGISTMTFTVGKMMTGTTVKQWNLEINARPSSDAQFYDQAKARLLSGYSREIEIVTPDGTSVKAKECLKTQSIFVDLVPNRSLLIDADKAQMRSYMERGVLDMEGVDARLAYEMEVMPQLIPQVMADNISHLFVPVTSADVMKIMTRYEANRSLEAQARFLTTVNEKWFENPIVGEWLDAAVAMDNQKDVQLLMSAFESEDGVFSDIDMDDVEGLSGLVEDARALVVARKAELDKRKKELEAKRKEAAKAAGGVLTDEEEAELAEAKKKLAEIAAAKKAADALRVEMVKKQRRLLISLATYAWCAPYDIASYKSAIKSLGHKYNGGSYKRCIEIAHNLGIDSAVIIGAYKSARQSDRFELDQVMYRMHELAYDETMTPMEKIRALFAKFPRLGDSEFVAPLWICEKMVAAIDDEVIRHAVEAGELLVAFSEEIGEFSIALYLRMMDVGYGIEDIRRVVAAIPTSAAAFEMTYKTYDMLGLDVRNIAKGWGTYDLYDKIVDKDYSYSEIADTLMRSSRSGYLCDATLEDMSEEEMSKNKKMVFGAIVGNPPYQVQNNGNSQGNTAIYDEFMDMAWAFDADTSVLITPSRFLNGIGVQKAWHKRVMLDPHLQVVEHFPNSKDVFSSNDIKGGVCITKRTPNEECGAIDFFIPLPELRSISDKVNTDEKQSMKTIIHLQNNLNLENLFTDYPALKEKVDRKTLRTNAFERMDCAFTDERIDEEQIEIWGLVKNKRVNKYISAKYLEDHVCTYKYKVLVPEANGSGALGEVLSTPLIGVPLIGHTETFIDFGPFESDFESKACYKYICSKFCRVMLGTKKTTQHNPPATWTNVPLQVFTKDSDIDWTQSIADIDKQLYEKYGLDEDEIAFIEENVKAME